MYSAAGESKKNWKEAMTWTAALWKVKVPSITKVSCECLKFFGCCIYCIVYCDYMKFHVLNKKI